MADKAIYSPMRVPDGNGDPVPGARVTFYASGTLTGRWCRGSCPAVFLHPAQGCTREAVGWPCQFIAAVPESLTRNDAQCAIKGMAANRIDIVGKNGAARED